MKRLVNDARQVIATSAGVNIRLAARRISQFLESRMRESDLGLPRFVLMAHIAAASDDTIGALAARTSLDQSTLSRNLRLLEHDGLVEIATVEEDLRQRAVWLTEAGARQLEAAMPVWRAAEAALSRLVASAEVRSIAVASAALLDQRALKPSPRRKTASSIQRPRPRLP